VRSRARGRGRAPSGSSRPLLTTAKGTPASPGRRLSRVRRRRSGRRPLRGRTRHAGRRTGNRPHSGASASLEDTVLLCTSRVRGVQIDTGARRPSQRRRAVARGHEPGRRARSGRLRGVVGYSIGGGLGWLARPLRSGLQLDRRRRGRHRRRRCSARRRRPRARPVLGPARRRRQLRGDHSRRARAPAGPRGLRGGAVLPAGARRGGTPSLGGVGARGARGADLGRTHAQPAAAPRASGLPAREVLRADRGAYLGSEADAKELLWPLRELGPDMDTFASMPAPGLQALHMDPPEPVPALSDYLVLADAPSRGGRCAPRLGRSGHGLAAALGRAPSPRGRPGPAGRQRRTARHARRAVPCSSESGCR